jgi:hypothetical protein
VRHIRSQDVIKNNEMGISEVLGSLHKVTHTDRVGTNFGLWEDNAKLHSRIPLVCALCA